jgi:hypothetical protein
MAVDREAEGKKIVDEDRITDNGDGSYSIKGTDYSSVAISKCNCPDKTIRRTAVCKHMFAVKFYQEKNNIIQTKIILIDNDILDYIKKKKSVSFEELKEELAYDDEELLAKLEKLLQRGEIYTPKPNIYDIL